jgi:iron-sulfur cluster repair protein YtfE (RIC family)
VRTAEETFGSVHSFFSWDHHRLDVVLDDVTAAVEAGELDQAQRTFVHYERGMRRHMRIEEEVVSLLYAIERTGDAKGPVEMMRREHADILSLIDEMGTALTRQDAAAYKAARDTLTQLLPEHHLKEEQMLYPLLDSLVGGGEVAQVVSRLRAR